MKPIAATKRNDEGKRELERGREHEDERVHEQGSATVWAVCTLMLISAAAGWGLIWTLAESTRHTTERAADSAALAAAESAVSRIVTQHLATDPCDAAATSARRSGAALVACTCQALDCTVSVERRLPAFGALADRLVADTAQSALATSRAGPVGETGAESEAS